jgi:hypothetical protein
MNWFITGLTMLKTIIAVHDVRNQDQAQVFIQDLWEPHKVLG